MIQAPLAGVRWYVVNTLLWDTTGCIVIGKYKRFEGTFCLHLHVLKRQQVLLKYWCPFTEL